MTKLDEARERLEEAVRDCGADEMARQMHEDLRLLLRSEALYRAEVAAWRATFRHDGGQLVVFGDGAVIREARAATEAFERSEQSTQSNDKETNR